MATTSVGSEPIISHNGPVNSTHDLKRSPLISISLNEKNMLPIIWINVTIPNINQTPPLILLVAATSAVIAPTSIAIDKYIAQLIGLAISYQLTTCDIEIAATNKIGIKNIDLIGLFFIHSNTFFIFLILLDFS